MKRTLNLDGEILGFKMTNGTYLEIDDLYGNAGAVINSVNFGMKAFNDSQKRPVNFGKDGFVNNSLKILSASCITRELSLKELEEKLTADQLRNDSVALAMGIYFDYIGIKPIESDEEEESEKKKE